MTTSLFFFIFVTALLNLGIGYALAVYLGHGPQLDLSMLALPGLWWGGRRALAEGVAAIPSTNEPGPDSRPTLDDKPRAVEGHAPPAPVSPLEDVLEPSQFQDNVSRLREEVHRHGRDITRIAERIVDAQTAPTRETLRQCTQDLADVNRQYLKRQRENLHCLAGQTPDDEAHATTCHSVQQAGQAHVSCLQDSLDAVDGIRLRDDNLETVCRQLLDETARQQESTKHFSGDLDTAIIGIIEAEYDVVESLHAPSAATDR